jgi:hypothetical protein
MTRLCLSCRTPIVLLVAKNLDYCQIAKLMGAGCIQAGRWHLRFSAGDPSVIKKDLLREASC